MNYAALPKIDKVIDKLMNEAQKGSQEPMVLSVLTECVRETVDRLRKGQIPSPENAGKEEMLEIACTEALQSYRKQMQPTLRRVINAAGVVLHTNLGRSVMAEAAAQAAYEAARGYCSVEMDLDEGVRGDRYIHIRKLICELTGAEDAIIVNNNAAAVLMVLDTLAKGGEAIISRSQLVEIGGGFRIPDVITSTGAILREVGTTNKTHLYDYENAVNENTSCLLQVHQSNFYMGGFVESVSTSDLAELAHKNSLPLIFDLGSGSLYPFAEAGVGHEPLPARLIAMGADVLTFSGDKMLGGPQAGIIVGKKEYISRIKKNHLLRALRIDKMTMAAMMTTLQLYRDKRTQEIPTISMLTMPEAELISRAEKLEAVLKPLPAEVHIRRGISPVGGGSLPDTQLPAAVVEVTPDRMSAREYLRRLRTHEPAVLGYIHENRACFDLRTVLTREIEELFDIMVEELK